MAKSDIDSFDMPTGLDDILAESSERGQVVGSWGFNPDVNFTLMSAEETNVWFFEQVFNFLRSFFGLVMPDNLEITTYNGKRRLNRDNLNQMTFLDELMLIMKSLKEPMWCLRLNVSIVGFLRTDWDPDKPIRLQIQEPASFVIWGGPDETGYQTFTIGFRLFSEQTIKGEHAMLWSVNQPLLEKALKKWERQSRHAIDIIESNSDEVSLGKYGFTKPAPSKARPKPKPKAPPPDKDLIPELDDILNL